jgi:hypothetical protein
MFSGPWGIVVVHANWPGHPTLIKKKHIIFVNHLVEQIQELENSIPIVF